MDVEVIEAGAVTEKRLLSLRPSDRVLVVDFFAPWCKTCPAKAKELEVLANGEYGEKHCVFVLVCVDGGIDAARDFAAAHDIKKCVIAAAVDDDAPSDLFQVKGLPHCSVIDRSGLLVRNYEVNLPVISTHAYRAPLSQRLQGMRLICKWRQLQLAPFLRNFESWRNQTRS
jgi:thiol-disulfide isomerase/thioredoxin